MDRIVFWSPTVYESVPYPSGVEFRLLDNVQPELTQNSIYLPTGAIDDVEAAWQFSWDRLSNTDLEALRRVKDLVSVNDPLGLEIVGYIESIAPTGLSGLTDDTQDTWYRVDVVFNVVHMQWPAFLTYVRNDERVLTADSTHGVGEGVYPPIVVRGQDVEVTDTKWLRFYGGEAMPWANHQLASSDTQKRSTRTLPASTGFDPRWLRLSGQQVHPQVGSIYTGMKSLMSEGNINFMKELALFSADNLPLPTPLSPSRHYAVNMSGGKYAWDRIHVALSPHLDPSNKWCLETFAMWTMNSKTWYGRASLIGLRDMNNGTGNRVFVQRSWSQWQIHIVNNGVATNYAMLATGKHLTLGTLQQIRLAHTMTGITLHVDGVLTCEAPVDAAFLASLDTFFVGDYEGYADGGWQGIVDDIRVWQTDDPLFYYWEDLTTDSSGVGDLVYHYTMDTPPASPTDPVPDRALRRDAEHYGMEVASRYTNVDTWWKKHKTVSGTWLPNKGSGTITVPADKKVVVEEPGGHIGIVSDADPLIMDLPLDEIGNFYIYVVLKRSYMTLPGTICELIEDGSVYARLSFRGSKWGSNRVYTSGGISTSFPGLGVASTAEAPLNQISVVSIYYEAGVTSFFTINGVIRGQANNVLTKTTKPSSSRQLRLLGQAKNLALYDVGIVLDSTRQEHDERMTALKTKYGIV